MPRKLPPWARRRGSLWACWFLAGTFLGCRLDSPPPSLLLISIDTLRADHLGIYGRQGNPTPVLDALAQQGCFIPQAFTPVPVTLPAHASLLTGRWPFRHGVRNNSFYRLPEEEQTLAEILSEKGYRTAAVVGAAVLEGRFGLAQGFDLYDDQIQGEQGQGYIAERSAQAVTRRALEVLKDLRRKGPFFLWVHYFDPHDPYRPPPPFAERFPHSPYLGEIAYVDDQIGRLVAEVGESTLVVVTSDHGEGLGEHGEYTHGIFLYDSTLRIPLILWGAGVQKDSLQLPAHPVGLVDVLPTLLSLLGLDPPRRVDGLDLTRPAPARPFWYAETLLPAEFYNWSRLRALRSSQWKFIEAPRPELYDLLRDPGEQENLAGVHLREAARLQGELLELVGEEREQRAARLAPDQETLERLRSLGYLAMSRPRSDPSRLPPDPKEMISLVALLDEALILSREKRWEEAEQRLKEILSRDPTNFLALHTLADLLFQADRPREALAAYRRVLELGREEPHYHYRLALLHRTLGEHEEAAREFAAVAALNPQVITEVLELVEGDLAQGREGVVRPYLDMLSEFSPRLPALDLPLVGLWRRLGEPERALDQVRKALSREPARPELADLEGEVLAELGARRAEQGRVREAEELLLKALQRLPGHLPAHANLGILYARTGQVEKALLHLEAALRIEPRVPLLNLTAELYFRRGDYRRALELLEHSLRLDPQQPRIRQARQEVLDRLP